MNTFKNILPLCGQGLMVFAAGRGRDATNMPVLFSKTARTEGRVTEVANVAIQDDVMNRMKYVFEADGQTYEGMCGIGGRFGQNPGERGGVGYIVNDPSDGKAVWFQKNQLK